MYKDNTSNSAVLRITGLVSVGLFLLLVLASGCRSKKSLVSPHMTTTRAATYYSPYADYDSLGHATDIDVTGIFDACEEVYMNVNIHWYLEDSCRGTLDLHDIQNIDREEVWAISRKMIDDLNSMYNSLGVNKQYRREQAPEYSEPHCVPLQMVLDDVLIHCKSKPRTTGVSFRKFYDDVVDADQVMNIFMSIVNTSVSGFAGGRGHMVVVEELLTGLLCHELGHNFGLTHPYQNERANTHTREKCMDVYVAPAIAWDGDGDGKLDSNKPKGNCWDTKPGGDQDKNGVGDFCEGIYKDNPHPCCGWGRQDNNVMMSSAWSKNPDYAAMSPCQTRTMLDKIQSKKIQYIQAVGGCPPPRAVLGIAPAAPGDQPSTTIHCEASSNVDQYQLSLFSDTAVLYRSKVIKGHPTSVNLNNMGGIRTVEVDSVALVVANVCGEIDRRGLSIVQNHRHITIK